MDILRSERNFLAEGVIEMKQQIDDLENKLMINKQK